MTPNCLLYRLLIHYFIDSWLIILFTPDWLLYWQVGGRCSNSGPNHQFQVTKLLIFNVKCHCQKNTLLKTFGKTLLFSKVKEVVGKDPSEFVTFSRHPNFCNHIHENYAQGGDYLVSWRLGCTSFTASEGAAYCSSNGIHPPPLTPQCQCRYGAFLTRPQVVRISFLLRTHSNFCCS